MCSRDIACLPFLLHVVAVFRALNCIVTDLSFCEDRARDRNTFYLTYT
jgi:hypothetical protein